MVGSKMYDLDTAQAWPVVSGPYGKGKAPKGRYKVDKPKAIEATEANKSFRDTEGLAWFAPITPLFQTDRTSLGIHPDGGVPGTLGCIGVKGATKGLYEFLAQAPNVSLFVL